MPASSATPPPPPPITAQRSDTIRSNGDLLDRTFLSLLVDGDIDEAVKYAERIAQADKNDRVAELVLGVAALKHKQFAAARRDLALSIRGPITDLTATLLSAWSMYGTGDAKGAVAAIDRLAGPEWYAIFKELHAGMIYDLAGNKKEAGKRFEHAYKLDPTALRVVEAYGSWLSRNAPAKRGARRFRGLRQGAAAPSAGGRGDESRSSPARNCRRW